MSEGKKRHDAVTWNDPVLETKLAKDASQEEIAWALARLWRFYRVPAPLSLESAQLLIWRMATDYVPAFKTWKKKRSGAGAKYSPEEIRAAYTLIKRDMLEREERGLPKSQTASAARVQKAAAAAARRGENHLLPAGMRDITAKQLAEYYREGAALEKEAELLRQGLAQALMNWKQPLN